MYRKRTLANHALAMPWRVEDATIRMVLLEKVARGTELELIDFVAGYTWDNGPMTVCMLLNLRQ